MIAAELLKLRRDRGVVWTALLCAFGLPLAALAMDASVGPGGWGGEDYASGAYAAAMWPGLAAACAIGVAAGTADRDAGVLRVLVATGRPRLALFAVRVPATVAVTALVAVVTWWAITLLGTAVHHDTAALRGVHALDQLPGMLTLNLVLALAGMGLGTAGLSSTQATSLLLGVVMGGLPVATSGASPDVLLALLPPLSVGTLLGGEQIVQVEMPAGLAAAGLAAWLVVPFVAGAHRARHAEV